MQSPYSGSAVVEIPASAGTKFRRRVFMLCCGLCRISGHLLQKQPAPPTHCGLRSATNTKPGFARSVVLASIDAFLWEARHFLGWQLERCGAEGLMEESVGDIDRYMDMRALKLTRSSLKCA